jgi:hypothetical protein
MPVAAVPRVITRVITRVGSVALLVLCVCYGRTWQGISETVGRFGFLKQPPSPGYPSRTWVAYGSGAKR